MTDTVVREQGEQELRLDVLGMTCGSCAARVEKTLNKQPGVEASVNFATGEAVVRLAEGAPTFEALRRAVLDRGYDIRKHIDETEEAARREERAWLRRLLVAWPLGIATMVVSMLWMDEAWARWAALLMATPVQFYAGWPFLKGAAIRARSFTASTLPVRAAVISTGSPSDVLAFGSAPDLSNASIAGALPFMAARLSGSIP